MKILIKRLIKKEKGAVLPFVIIVLAILLGFTALVIDAGFLYYQRKALVTAADAGALAGAKELSDKAPDFTQTVQDTAANIAKETVIANIVANKINGVEADDVSVVIETRNVSYKNASGDYVNKDRKIIEVKVNNNVPTIFAKFLGNDTADVGASAVATWGFTKSISGGDILPIFILEDVFNNATGGSLVYLNGDKFLEDGSAVQGGDKVPGNWGLFNIKDAVLDPFQISIKEALSGESSSKNMVLKKYVESEGGNKIGQVNDVILRMENAVKRYPTEDNETQIGERQKFMQGLVPIIDPVEFLDLNTVVNGKLPNPLILPIESFAVFEIRDYLPTPETGTPEALDTAKYWTKGTAATYTGYSKNTIVGVFTGDEVPVISQITDGDQELGAGEIKTLTYQKLIK